MPVSSIAVFSRDDDRQLLELANTAGFSVAGRFSPTNWLPAGAAARASPMPPSILAVALAYGNQPVSDPDDPWASGNGSPPAGAWAEIAPFARRDYYGEAVRRLKALAVSCRSRWGGVRSDYRVYCNSRIQEKPLALMAGLGDLGRNTLILTDAAGSLVVLAALALPFRLTEPATPEAPAPVSAPAGFPRCLSCRACVDACPVGALDGHGHLDTSRCLQAWASRPGAVPPDIALRWGRRLYGCQSCQDACPHNRRPIAGAATERGALPARFSVAALTAASDAELRSHFRGTVLGRSWLGPDLLRRNAALAAAAD